MHTLVGAAWPLLIVSAVPLLLLIVSVLNLRGNRYDDLSQRVTAALIWALPATAGYFFVAALEARLAGALFPQSLPSPHESTMPQMYGNDWILAAVYISGYSRMLFTETRLLDLVLGRCLPAYVGCLDARPSSSGLIRTVARVVHVRVPEDAVKRRIAGSARGMREVVARDSPGSAVLCLIDMLRDATVTTLVAGLRVFERRNVLW